MRKYYSAAGLLAAVAGLVLILSHALMLVLSPAGGISRRGLVTGVILLALGCMAFVAGKRS